MSSDETTRGSVGFLGLGPMGMPMAHALADAGWRVVAWNRTASKVADLQQLSTHVTAAGTPAEVAARASVVISMLPDLPQLQERLDGPDGLLAGWAGARPDEAPVIVVMGTVSPVGLTTLQEWLAGGELPVSLVDAPVSGGPPGAIERRLSIMVGGAEADVARVRPLLDAMGTTVRHLGPLGSGELAKACNQIVVGATLTALGEALTLARAGGLDSAEVLDILAAGLAGSEALTQKRERLLSGDFSGGGKSVNQVKDLAIILETARRYGVRLPLSEVADDLYRRLVAQGGGDLDHSAVITVLAADTNDTHDQNGTLGR